MKIYKMTLDLSLVVSRLRNISLKEFNSENPIIFVEAENPDDACYKCYYKFASLVLQQDPEMAGVMKEILRDITIRKMITP
jgi:hypothetical protein